MLSFFIGVFVLWAMSVELDMQHLNKTIESGDQITYIHMSSSFINRSKYLESHFIYTYRLSVACTMLIENELENLLPDNTRRKCNTFFSCKYNQC